MSAIQLKQIVGDLKLDQLYFAETRLFFCLHCRAGNSARQPKWSP